MVEKETRPLVVCNSAGKPIDALLENDKGFKKSLESGTLWSLHPDTDRLLPYAGGAGEGAVVTIEDCGTWYRAVLGGEGTPPETPARETVVGPAPNGPADGVHADTPAGAQMGAVLGSLVSVIRDRRREMPEGSYTTHLFTAGKDKIRKKTGEEAIELILAGDKAALTSEAADFIYHLLVLLEVEGVSLDDIAAELKER